MKKTNNKYEMPVGQVLTHSKIKDDSSVKCGSLTQNIA